MQYGAFLPHLGPLARGDVLNRLKTTAQTAEALGFDSVWVADHIITPKQIASRYPYSPNGAFPLDPQSPLLEPLSVLSFVAACTHKVRLGTAVLVLPHGYDTAEGCLPLGSSSSSSSVYTAAACANGRGGLCC